MEDALNIVDAEVEEENAVTRFLGDLIKADPQFHYKGRFWTLRGVETPPRAALLFVREQVKAFEAEIKKVQG